MGEINPPVAPVVDIVGTTPVEDAYPASGFISCAYVGVDPTESNDHAARVSAGGVGWGGGDAQNGAVHLVRGAALPSRCAPAHGDHPALSTRACDGGRAGRCPHEPSFPSHAPCTTTASNANRRPSDSRLGEAMVRGAVGWGWGGEDVT